MTCLVSGLHASHLRHRESISMRGLLPARPTTGRPFGVYVFREDGGMDHPTFGRGGVCAWSHGRGQDVYRVGYFGQVINDYYVQNGWVLLDKPQLVTLVSGNIE